MLRDNGDQDADKILTVLTPGPGQALNDRRGARRQEGSHVLRGLPAAPGLLEMTLYERAVDMLDAADTIELFDGPQRDPTALSLAAYFAELTGRRCPTAAAATCCPLLLNALAPSAP